MSHYITGVQNQPINFPSFNNPPTRQFIAPRFRKKLKGIKPESKNRSRRWVEEGMIKDICKKLTDRQFAIMQRQNATYINRKLSNIKHKLKKSLNGSKSVSRFFDEETERQSLDLKDIYSKMPEKLDLGKKYNNKMIISLQMAKQAHKISIGKTSYLSWLDRQNNSPLKSPNYQKMNFVFEKLQFKKLKQQKSKIKQQNSSVFELLYRKQKNRSYGSIQRRVKTLGHEPLIRNVR